MSEGCACTELCSMGPTCPGGMLAGLPGSGCHRSAEGEYIEPPAVHRHALPGDDSQRPIDTLAFCRPCGRWFYWDWPPDDFVGSWAYPRWNPVRWYHFRLRRRISNSERMSP